MTALLASQVIIGSCGGSDSDAVKGKDPAR